MGLDSEFAPSPFIGLLDIRRHFAQTGAQSSSDAKRYNKRYKKIQPWSICVTIKHRYSAHGS